MSCAQSENRSRTRRQVAWTAHTGNAIGMFSFVGLLLRRVPRRQAFPLIALAVVFTLGGGVLFAVAEHYSIGTGIYFAITTATTVGYGDVTPHNAIGRVIAVGIMLTTIPLLAAVFALWAGAVASEKIRRLLGMEHHLPTGPYRLVIGSHPTVPRILEELERARLAAVVVADIDSQTMPVGVELIKGDPTNIAVLRQAHPERAEQALIVGEDDGAVLVTAILLRQLAPDLPVAALTQSTSVAEALRDLGVSRTVSSDELLGHTLAKSLEAPHAADLLLRLVDSEQYELREVPVGADDVGLSFSALRDRRAGLVLGLVQEAGVTLGVAHDPVVDASDRILLVTPAPGRSEATKVRSHL